MKKLMTAAGMVATLVSGGVSAGSTSYWFLDEVTQLSDNSAEYLINISGGNRTLDVGDKLRGIFTIETSEGLTSGGKKFPVDGSSFNELSGVFEIEALTKTFFNATTCFTTWCWTFGPTSDFEAEYGAGAMVAFFDDPVYEFSRVGGGTTDALEDLVTDGNLLMVAGLGGTGGVGNEFWAASAVSDNIDTIGSTAPPGNGGSFNIGVDLLVNNTGYVFNAVDCGPANSGITTDLCGSGSLLGTGNVTTPYDSFDDVNFTMYRVSVPEPSMVLLFGASLLVGSGFARRRVRKGA